jgi:hypothetical protein
MKGYAGYWTGYSYRGRMPDGRWEYFVSPTEYHEAYDDEELKKLQGN